jgi:peptide deformylase
MKKVQENYSLVGLASPQIGIELRVFILSFGDHLKEKFKPEVYKAKEMSNFPSTVFINPAIKVLDHKKVIFEESCASIVGFAAEVARNYSVQVDALDANGKPISHVFTGWNARIAQHENDHLEGILFTDIMDRKTLRCTNWETVNAKSGRIEVPYYPK